MRSLEDRIQQRPYRNAPCTRGDHMKILTSLSIALVIILAGCGHISTADKVKGSGIVKTEKRSLTPFDSLEVVCHGSIKVNTQGQEGLEISGDDNILPL